MLGSYTTEFALQEHDYYCSHHEARRVIVDDADVQFKNFNHSLQVPAVIYADSETFLQPISTCANNPKKSFTQQIHKHIPSSYAYYVKGIDGRIDKRIAHTAVSADDAVMQHFVNNLARTAARIYNTYEA
jgi:hypothetical protein